MLFEGPGRQDHRGVLPGGPVAVGVGVQVGQTRGLGWGCGRGSGRAGHFFGVLSVVP
ncbi:hypothetical protein ACFFX0_21710 [Citricoccus parietis]|uniref:Uncharacterized protein n=1 Tax=Citricoccus parietis TaxID=592307 RepID=A0ABV5G441_9MICC